MDTLISKEVQTPLGKLLAVSSQQGLCLLEYADVEARLEQHKTQLEKIFKTTIVAGESPILTKLKQQLEEYFKGERKTFDLAIDYRGTEFQESAWDALTKIPYGETRSYKDQATAINKPAAVRAVANANNRNKISIIVPCHRVIGKDGSMTGYGGEIWRKEFLLRLENAIPSNRDLFSKTQ